MPRSGDVATRLLVFRLGAEQFGVEIPFLPPPEPYTPAEEETTETTQLRNALLERAEEGDWRELLARLLEYHKREARPAWWWYFRRHTMADDELMDDGEAIGCLEHDGAAPFDLSTVNRRARSHDAPLRARAAQPHARDRRALPRRRQRRGDDRRARLGLRTNS